MTFLKTPELYLFLRVHCAASDYEHMAEISIKAKLFAQKGQDLFSLQNTILGTLVKMWKVVNQIVKKNYINNPTDNIKRSCL